MDVDTSWRRKRPVEEDEDYLASKRYISEKFFNMRISHPDMPGLHRSAGSMWQGSADKAAGVGGEIGEAEGSSMSDEDVPDAHAPPNPTATATTPASSNAPFAKTASLDEGSDALSDSDSDNAGGGPAGAAGGGPPTPHPFLRSASSAADEKVDDWVRTSRHRMLADASVNSAPDLCRALILYKPVGPSVPSTASEAATTCEGEDGDGEGGGDPTPSPQAGGDGGGEIAPAVGAGLGATKRGAEQRGPDGSEQSAGSSTAEAAGFTGGGGRTDQPNSYGNGHTNQRVAGSLFAPRSRGLCTTQSGGDAAGGARVVRDSNSSSSGMLLAREESVEMMQARSDSDVDRAAAAAASSTDAMEMDAAGDEGVGGNRESWDMAPPEAPVLTRVGTSRGAPTPELTPERAAWARAAPQRRGQVHGQDPNEVAGGPSARPALTPQAWAQW